jgi:uncharacterized protein (DUF3084 family)
MKETTKDLILRLKRIKEEEQLSYSNILRMIEENGDHLGSATIARVFANGSENQNFRYYDTLKPIAKVLLKLEEKEDGISDEEQATKDVALIKDMEYRMLLEKYESMKKRYEERVKYLEDRVEYLKEQVAIHQAAIERKDAQIEARDISISKRDQVIENLSRIAVIAVEKEKKE